MTANRSRPDFLTADQLDVLDGFQRLSTGERVFLVIDDVGWLDAEPARQAGGLRQAMATGTTPVVSVISG